MWTDQVLDRWWEAIRARRFRRNREWIAERLRGLRPIVMYATGPKADLSEIDWYTVGNVAQILQCSPAKVLRLVRDGQFGLAGTVSDHLPLRDLNPRGTNRQYRFHRTWFEADPALPGSAIGLVKAPTIRINGPRKADVSTFSDSYARWSNERAQIKGR